MADEILLTGQTLTLINGELKDRWTTDTQKIDQTTARKYADTQNIGTSHEALAKGSITTPGWARFKNLDATNYVEIGTDVAAAFQAFLKLKPGEQTGWVRLATTAPYAQANTAAIELQYELLED